MPMYNDDEIQVESNSGSGLDFMKLQSGENKIRILSTQTFVYKKHSFQAEGKFTSVTCPGKDCLLCNQDTTKRPSQRFVWLVLDRKDNKIKVLEVGVTVWIALNDLRKDSEYGDFREYDVTIKKTGSGQDTKYSIIPARTSTPLTVDEQMMYAEAKSTEEAFDKIFYKRVSQTITQLKEPEEEINLDDVPFL